jgi:carbamoyl-phosphate synthase large subunit
MIHPAGKNEQEMNIIITSAGQRVSLVRAFQKELGYCQIDGRVFTTDLKPDLCSACVVSDNAFKVGRFRDPDYIDILLALCIENKVKMVIPTIDTELLLLAENKSLFKDNDIDIIISSVDFVKICRDKRKTHLFFKERGIDTPELIDKNNPHFPLFIKPYDGSCSTDIYVIRKKEELSGIHLNNEKFMFMEYIDREIYDEYTVDLYYGKDHHIKSVIPRKRIAVRAGEILKGVTCKNEIMDFVKDKLSYVEGAVGCITLQLFYSEQTGKMIGIEINPRFGGGFPLSYEAKGNYPGWLIREYFFHEEISYSDAWEDNLLMLRYDSEIIVHGYKN